MIANHGGKRLYLPYNLIYIIKTEKKTSQNNPFPCVHAYNPSSWLLGQEDYEFETSLDDIDPYNDINYL
jgi:hypothetical protein